MRRRYTRALWISAVVVLVTAPLACRKFYGEPAPSSAPNAPPADAGIDVAVPPQAVDAGAASAPTSVDASPPPSPDGIFRVNEPTRGTVPAASVKQRVTAAMPAITACYERALSQHPALRGNLLIQFVVAADGSVASATPRPIADPIEDESVIACIASEFRKLSFPKPSGDRAVVTYPLHFEPPVDAGEPASK
jgi:hypothetical protein